MLIKFNSVYFIPDKFKLLSSEENRYILNDISFYIKDVMSAIVGRSGSGKSTIARMILGEILPNRGTVEINPEGKRVSVVFQNSLNLLNPYRTGISQLRDVNKVFNNEGNFNSGFDYLVERLGISAQIMEKKAGELSGGQRQRLAICRQLLFKPDLLVLDEPFAAQDAFYKERLSTVLKDYCGSNKIQLICISHELQYLTNLCEYFIVVENGRIADEGDIAIIKKNPRSEISKELLKNLAL